GSDFDQIGFLYPHVTSQAEREQFEKGLSFAMVVGMPMMRREELPRDAEGAVKCPDAWTYEIDGVKQCDLLLDGIDMGAGEGKGTGWDSASGGTAGAMRTTAHGDAGKMANAWKRVQWSLAQARIAYRPDGASGDPTINDIGVYGPNDPAALNKIRMQMFWPAWQAELTH